MANPGKRHVEVQVGDAATTAVYEPSKAGPRVVFVCAHGAGGNMADRGMVAVCDAQRARGISTVRFNFLNRRKSLRRRHLPMTFARLIVCLRAHRTRCTSGTGQLTTGMENT